MKTYVLTTTDVQGGRREGFSSNTWGNMRKNPDGTCVIGRRKTGGGSDDYNFYTTYFLFDADALTALREKTVISITLSITAASGVIPAEGSDIFRVGYKYNDEVASDTRNNAWTRSIDADGTAIGTVSIGYLRNDSGGETVADNTPVVIDLTGSSIPKYGYVMGTSSSQNLNKTVTVAPSAILTIVTDEVSTYTVDYDANGGSGAPQSQTKEAGTPLTLSSVTPKRSGYKFDAWNTAADGTGVEYPKGSQYNFDAAVTLYAQWTLLSGSGVWVKGSDGEMHQGTVWVKGTDSAMHEASVYVKGTDSEMHQSS